MKILHLKGYKWFLSQNQQVGNNFFGYRQYEALESERASVPGLLRQYLPQISVIFILEIKV